MPRKQAAQMCLLRIGSERIESLLGRAVEHGLQTITAREAQLLREEEVIPGLNRPRSPSMGPDRGAQAVARFVE
jgi:hypothetical protein